MAGHIYLDQEIDLFIYKLKKSAFSTPLSFSFSNYLINYHVRFEIVICDH